MKLFLSLLICSSFFSCCGPCESTVPWDRHHLQLEFALTQAERIQGLQNHVPLKNDEGMLFVYSEPKTLRFWMKNVPFPIDLAYFDEHGALISIHKMTPLSLEPISSPQRAKFVLEMRLGWFEEKNIQIGSIWPYLTQENWPKTR